MGLGGTNSSLRNHVACRGKRGAARRFGENAYDFTGLSARGCRYGGSCPTSVSGIPENPPLTEFQSAVRRPNATNFSLTSTFLRQWGQNSTTITDPSRGTTSARRITPSVYISADLRPFKEFRVPAPSLSSLHTSVALSPFFRLEEQQDRRQQPDRRRQWRGGRRVSDFNAVVVGAPVSGPGAESHQPHPTGAERLLH